MSRNEILSGVSDAFAFFRRHLRATLRFPSAIAISAFHPFIWMVLFGPLFRSVSTIKGFRGGSYYQFLAPGIAVMSALFGAGYSGFVTLGEIQNGLLDKFLATPVARSAIVVGPIINTALQTICQAAVIMIAALALGARPHGVFGVLLVFVTVGLLGSTVAALSHSVALITKTQRMLVSIVNLVSMPLVFVSSMMMPRELMPPWMRVVATVNPVEWAVTACRGAFSFRVDGDMLLLLVPLTAICVGALLFAWQCVVRYQRLG